MVLRDGCIEAFGPRDEVLQNQIRPAGQASNPHPAPVPANKPAAVFTTGAVTGRFG
jgi:ABC-type protease/lipase transport system fused ATPase/permease subunit